MIHLDTNLLIDLVTANAPDLMQIRKWIGEGEEFAASAVTWSEFCNGPHSREQKDAVHHILRNNVLPFDELQAEHASRLFHYTGRRRGSHADCMIAAAAICNGAPVATRNITDFERFIPHGLKLNAIPTTT